MEIKRFFDEQVLMATAEPLKEEASDTVRWTETDTLYIGDLEDGVYHMGYLDRTAYVKGHYVYGEDCCLMETMMISVQSKNAAAWGMESRFFRLIEERGSKKIVAIESGDYNAITEFLDLCYENPLPDGIADRLYLP